MEDKEILSMTGIVKEYNMGGEVSRVLKGIDLTVNEGEFLAVLGPSGSGKSTLLRCFNGLKDYQSGSIVALGKEVKDLSKKELQLMQKNMGMTQ